MSEETNNPESEIAPEATPEVPAEGVETTTPVEGQPVESEAVETPEGEEAVDAAEGEGQSEDPATEATE